MTAGFRGMIRKENVRETERDRVDIYKSFRPGNIVLAKVVSFFYSFFVIGDSICALAFSIILNRFSIVGNKPFFEL